MLSEEQQLVLDKVKEGCHITVQAYPGCGKSSRIIGQIVSQFPTKKIMIVSYNKGLVKLTNEYIANTTITKNRDMETYWVCAKTYHGLMSSLVRENIHNDILFHDALQYKNFAWLARDWLFGDFDMLIIDEAQDMRRDYYFFLCVVIALVCKRPEHLQLALLGDARQVLYAFYPINKADARFLVCAEQMFTPLLQSLGNMHAWFHGTLSVSYRVTPQIAAFINALVPSRHMISGKLRSTRITNWVTLYIADIYRDTAQIVYDIIKRARARRTNYGDIMVLFSSLNECSPAIAVVDLLVANKIPVHVERSGRLARTNENNTTNNGSNNNTSQNKVTLRTFCGAKGLEAEEVIVVNNTELLAEEFVTNPKYVSLSRPKKWLSVIQTAYYTSQSQLDMLCAKMTQRDLRVIVKRPLLQELRVREPKKHGAVYSKNALNSDTLFAFIDASHLAELVAHVRFDVVMPGLYSEQEGEEDEEGKGDGDDDSMPWDTYIAEMTCSYDQGHTHMNLVNICSTALMLALEFVFTHKTPVTISRILTKIGTHMDPKYCVMRNRTRDALEVLFSEKTEDYVALARKHLSAFAQLAIVQDAFEGYRELLNVIPNGDFILMEHVFSRYDILVTTLQQILTSSSTVAWNQEYVGRFMHEGEPVQVRAVPSIVGPDFLVMFIGGSSFTGHEDRLHAVVASLVIPSFQQQQQQQEKKIYLLNMFDASMQMVELVSDATQPLVTVSTDEETETKQKVILPRYVPCKFLHDAITHKIGSNHADCQDEETGLSNEDKKQETDATFISDMIRIMYNLVAQHKNGYSSSKKKEEEEDDETTTLINN